MASASQLNHLLKWLETFSVRIPCGNAREISDGVALAHIAHQIDPLWFDDSFLSKIKPDVGTNKIIKESNLKKVLEKLLDFYRDRLDQRLSGFVSPDVNKIADHNDEAELCRMLQLLLGCAIHSDRKDEFIPAIMGMEEDVQQAIMRAIQELLAAGDSWDSATDSMFASVGMATSRPQPQPLDLELRRLTSDLEAANEARGLLERKCDQLISQVAILQDENQRLVRETEKLRKADIEKDSNEDKEKDSSGSETRLRRQVESLREKINELETSRDECRGRSEELERELEEMHKRQELLQNSLAENKRLKDELDILRESAARATRAESTVESLRRKVEEVTKLKQDLRILEDKNAEYIQKNIDLEEEIKKLGPWKTQLEVQRKQLSELQANLTEETKRADRFEFERNKLKEKFEALAVEKERLLAERDALRETNEELRFAQLNSSPKRANAGAVYNPGVDTLDMIPHDIKEKLLRLEHENRVLRQKDEERSESSSERAEVLQPVIDGLQERIHQLETENRKSNKRVLELESQVEEMRSVSPASSSSMETLSSSEVKELKTKVMTLTLRLKNLEKDLQQKGLNVEELEVKLSEQEQRASMFQEAIHRKDTEMAAMEERYKKYIEKAKMVMKTLDPKINPAIGGSPELMALQSQLREKDRIIESLEREMEKHKLIQETEQNLMTTAFYNLGMQLTRGTSDQRLDIASAAAANQGNNNLQSQSFLARQRQAAVRGRSATEAYDH